MTLPDQAAPSRPARRRRRGRLILVALVLAAAAVWVKLTYFTATEPSYVTTPVKTGNVEVTVLANGILKPTGLVAVGAQVSGRITAVNVVAGQKVKAGDLIAQIDSASQQSDLDKAKAALDDIRAQLDEKQATLTYAQSALAREQRTLEQSASSAADYDQAVETVAVTKAQIAQIQAQIRENEVAVSSAQTALDYTRITAPTDGTILQVVVQAGQTVNAVNSAPTIAVMGNTDTMQVQADISEADVVKVKPGLPVEFTILGDPDHPYRTTLQSIDPAPITLKDDSAFSTTSSSSTSSSSSSSSAIYYTGLLTVPNPDGRLRTYMTAEVHIILGAAKNVLTLPAMALGAAAADGHYTVRVLGPDGKPARRKITIGLNDKVTAEVTSGLAEGDEVIIGNAGTSAPGTTRSTRPRMPPMGL